MHMIRKQAAIDMTHKSEEGIFIKEQDIDNCLITKDYTDEDDNSITSSQQQYQSVQEKVRAAIQGLHRGATRLQPNQAPARTAHIEHDWDFFYHSLLAAPETRSAILTTMSSGKKPVLRSELRTQRITALFERFGKKQHAMQTAIRKQRNVNLIVDTGAKVKTMPECAVNQMPAAHNHRDAPPGTAVKYGNGEIEAIERLVDIGHYEVQVTPDNCSTSLISVDQIVEDGHTVTFSATETIIIDDNDRYSVALHTPAYQTHGNGPSPCKRWKTSPDSVRTIHNTAIDNHRPPRAGRKHRCRACSSAMCAARGCLHEFVKSKRRKVLHLHKRMIHAPEDIMC